MQILSGFLMLATIAAAMAWFHFGTAAVKRKMAHYLMASAAGDDARERAIAEAMKQTLRVEGE